VIFPSFSNLGNAIRAGGVFGASHGNLSAALLHCHCHLFRVGGDHDTMCDAALHDAFPHPGDERGAPKEP
jgi:hypothetical protein